VDLTIVTFVDSSVLHWLARTDRRARQARLRLEVVVAPGRVRDMLSIAGLDGHLVLVDAT
jgi:anti-anti-sigma regulatory factor